MTEQQIKEYSLQILKKKTEKNTIESNVTNQIETNFRYLQKEDALVKDLMLYSHNVITYYQNEYANIAGYTKTNFTYTTNIHYYYMVEPLEIHWKENGNTSTVCVEIDDLIEVFNGAFGYPGNIFNMTPYKMNSAADTIDRIEHFITYQTDTNIYFHNEIELLTNLNYIATGFKSFKTATYGISDDTTTYTINTINKDFNNNICNISVSGNTFINNIDNRYILCDNTQKGWIYCKLYTRTYNGSETTVYFNIIGYDYFYAESNTQNYCYGDILTYSSIAEECIIDLVGKVRDNEDDQNNFINLNPNSFNSLKLLSTVTNFALLNESPLYKFNNSMYLNENYDELINYTVTRLSMANLRKNEIKTFLTSTNGQEYYDSRWECIEKRINRTGGTLGTIVAYFAGVEKQAQALAVMKPSNNFYNKLMLVIPVVRTGFGNHKVLISAEDSELLSVGDNVYIIDENQGMLYYTITYIGDTVYISNYQKEQYKDMEEILVSAKKILFNVDEKINKNFAIENYMRIVKLF